MAQRIAGLMEKRGEARVIAKLVGKSPSTVSRFAEGRGLTAEILDHLADHSGQSVDWLLGREQQPRSNVVEFVEASQRGFRVDSMDKTKLKYLMHLGTFLTTCRILARVDKTAEDQLRKAIYSCGGFEDEIVWIVEHG